MASDLALKYAHAVARHGQIPDHEVEDLAQEIRLALFRWPTDLTEKACRFATGAYFVARQPFGCKEDAKAGAHRFVSDEILNWQCVRDVAYERALLGEIWEFCELIGKERYLMEWWEQTPDRQALAREWGFAPQTLYSHLNHTINAVRDYFKA